ncbi:MAG: hypothetical protein AB1645_09285 [Bacillota bacterium]
MESLLWTAALLAGAACLAAVLRRRGRSRRCPECGGTLVTAETRVYDGEKVGGYRLPPIFLEAEDCPDCRFAERRLRPARELDLGGATSWERGLGGTHRTFGYAPVAREEAEAASARRQALQRWNEVRAALAERHLRPSREEGGASTYPSSGEE